MYFDLRMLKINYIHLRIISIFMQNFFNVLSIWSSYSILNA